MKQEEDKIVNQDSTLSQSFSSEKSSAPKKARKQYEWTPKRKEAFDKMRKGLEEKVSLTKRIKDEKKRAEKDAIKAKVKEIMNSKKGPIVTQESDSSSGESSSEDEAPVRRKKSKEEKKSSSSKIAKPSSKRKGRKQESSDEEQETASASSSEEEFPRREQAHFTSKQHHHYQKDKIERGKAVKVAQFVNPLDQFILL